MSWAKKTNPLKGCVAELLMKEELKKNR